LQPEQTVEEMANEVLMRQAEAEAERSGEPIEEAMWAVVETEAGKQLAGLRDGPTRRRASRSGRRVWPGSVPGSAPRTLAGASARSPSTPRTVDGANLLEPPQREVSRTCLAGRQTDGAIEPQARSATPSAPAMPAQWAQQ
jgi:hypothetical protein